MSVIIAATENKEVELQKVDEVIITQSGTRFLEDQIMMEEMLEQLAEKRREIDRLNDQALKNSVEFQNLKSQLQTSNMHLFKMLDEHEGRFDSDEKFESPEICRDYIDAALYCQNYFGRANNRVQHAQAWYDNLNPWEQTDKL